MLKRPFFGTRWPLSTTFRRNAYIDRLNLTLQIETITARSYQACRRRKEKAAQIEQHFSASKALVRLIIENRGVPEDRPFFRLELTPFFVRASDSLPCFINPKRWLFWRLEARLVRAYAALLRIAPAKDQEILRDLEAKAKEQLRRVRRHENLGFPN